MKIILDKQNRGLREEVKKHRDKILLLLREGVLDTRNGRVTIHFDKDNVIRKIETKEVSYKA